MNGHGEDCPLSAAEGALCVAPAEPKLGVHSFTDSIFDQTVCYQVLKMESSFWVWIGSEPAKLENLAVAMATRLVCILLMMI